MMYTCPLIKSSYKPINFYYFEYLGIKINKGAIQIDVIKYRINKGRTFKFWLHITMKSIELISLNRIQIYTQNCYQLKLNTFDKIFEKKKSWNIGENEHRRGKFGLCAI